MATQVQNRRGTTAEHSTFTGANGEVTVDTDKEVVVVHDGTTAGGYPQMRENGSNSALALGSAATPSLKFTGDTNTGIYSPGADQVAISTNSSERIRIGANGEIGIGGANYGTSGQVLTSGGSGVAPSWQTPAAANTDKIEEGNSSAEVIDTGSDGRFVVTTEGSERLRIDSSGRVGVGTTSPGSIFEVKSPDQNPNIFRLYNAYNTAGSSWGIDFYRDSNSGTNLATAEIKAVREGGEQTSLKFGTSSTSGTVTERARIDSSGRLLVGTSTSRSDLVGLSPQIQVEGSSQSASTVSATRNSNDNAGSAILLAKSRGTTAGAVTIVQNNDILGGVYFMGADGTNVEIGAQITGEVDGTPGNNDLPSRLVFSTTADGASSATERMRIDNAGRVSIATVANNGFNFSVSGASSAQFGDEADISYGAVQISRPADQPDNKFHLCLIRKGQKAAGLGFLDNSSTFAIQNADNNTGNGVTLTNGATSWGTTSDERKKRISASIENGLAKISDWRCVYFSYLNEPEDIVRVGLVAQDVQQTLPEAVSIEEDDIGTLQLKYTELIPVLVKALQESKQRIETLEAKVAALESA